MGIHGHVAALATVRPLDKQAGLDQPWPRLSPRSPLLSVAAITPAEEEDVVS